MVTKKSNGKDKVKADFKSFHEPTFSSEEREAIGGRYAADVDAGDLLMEFTQEGYKIGITWDDKHNCHIVTVFGRWKGSPNEGVVLSVKHLDWVKALVAALYYHVEVCDRQSWVKGDMTSEFDW